MLFVKKFPLEPPYSKVIDGMLNSMSAIFDFLLKHFDRLSDLENRVKELEEK